MFIESNEPDIPADYLEVARQACAMRPVLPNLPVPANWRADAATSITTTARQLLHIVSETYRQEFPELRGLDFLPAPKERASLGMTQFTWHEIEARGKALITPTMVMDAPSVDVGIEEAPLKRFAWIQQKYGWTQQDMWTQAETGVSLQTERGEACKQIIAQTHDDILLIADGSRAYGGLYGLFTLPSTPSYTIDVGATSGATTWLGKTGEEIFTDLLRWFHAVVNNTNTVETPNRTIIPEQAWQIAREKRMGDANQQDPIKHFLEVVREKVPNYQVESSIKLNTIGNGRAITYVAGDEKRVMRNDVMEFYQFAPVIVGTGIEVHCLAKTGGAVAKRFKSLVKTDGILA